VRERLDRLGTELAARGEERQERRGRGRRCDRRRLDCRGVRLQK
jgi:hypothetical protein